MAKLPREPDLARLRGLEPTLITLPTGSEFHRIYFRGGRHPTRWNAFRYFGPTASRFDHHLPDAHGNGYVQARGVMYVADHILTSLAEVFQHQRRTIQRWRGDPWLVSFALQSDLVLLDLSGHFAVRAGTSMKLMSGPTVYSRNWARGFYEVYEQACGIYYPSSLTNDPAIVLNERADRDEVFPYTPLFHRALKDPGLLTPLRIAAEELNYDIV